MASETSPSLRCKVRTAIIYPLQGYTNNKIGMIRYSFKVKQYSPTLFGGCHRAEMFRNKLIGLKTVTSPTKKKIGRLS